LEGLGILPRNLAVQIIHFLLMFWILRRFLYQPILGLFDERRERIREGLAAAERVREEAAAERAELEKQISEERRTSQERLREAVARSEEAAERRLSEANAEAEQILARARAEAESTRREALAGLQGEIADLAVGAAGKVLGAEIDPNRHRQLIDRFLKEELGGIA
jgi:F-type H+-transporting ATPase subunit b